MLRRWFPKLWNRSRNTAEQVQGRMTFGQTSIGRGLTRTRLLLKKQLWIWPIIAIVLLAFVGRFVGTTIERTMSESLNSELTTLLTVEQAMLEKWFRSQEMNAQALANDRGVRQVAVGLLAAQPPEDAAAEANIPDDPAKRATLQAELGKELEAGLSSNGYVGYIVADKQHRIIAATTKTLVGQEIPQYESFLTRALNGHPTVSVPFPSVVMQKDRTGKMSTGTPTMFACAPILDENLQVVAALAIRIEPEKEFTQILQLGRYGQTGETYAINKAGVMVSNSRFDQEMTILGLLPDQDGAASILTIQVRDPGGNLANGFRPTVRRRELPLTEICTSAIAGGTGVNMQGYRDYTGEWSIGAYTWLPNYDLGLITEINASEAFRPLTILKYVFFSLYALLGLGAVAIFIFSIIVARLRRDAQKAAIAAKQLGQYRLQEKIGAGGMGVVYKGQHAMLRRPTAIKLLDVEHINEAAIKRFEREVQVTCCLNNPHTVAIYDYGRTPEGVFHYAMEYLDGITLQSLVEQYGPQPEGRVVKILQQVCASLFEAHSLGIVHRDIKPANIMLNRRGAEPDVAKVLDFGLVKSLTDRQSGAEERHGLSGTPLYMSPEAIQTPEAVDARSDLYAVGAVGYFLLTGRTIFDARSLSELCQLHITTTPALPSQCLGQPVSPELEHALLACLEKSPAKRPQTARDLATLLLRVSATWTLDDAEGWWSRHERQTANTAAKALTGASSEQPLPTAAAPPAKGLKGTQASGFDRTVLFGGDDDA